MAWSLSDCYALGNVFADMPTGYGNSLNVGALVGCVEEKDVEHCFAAGSVIAQMNSSRSIDAGGLVGVITGYGLSLFLKDSAALGASITVTGGNPQRIGRIIGDNEGPVGVQNNYANNDMRLYYSSTYGSGRPTEIPTVPPGRGSGNEPGLDANTGNFHNPVFWQTTLNFSTTNWDFSEVVSKGYPRLKDSDGAIMGGQ
jgi:hypothetical protein